MSYWNIKTPVIKDKIFTLLDEYKKDNNPNKVNLIIGSYKDNNGESIILDSVKLAKKKLKIDNYDYLPLRGNSNFINSALNLLYENPINISAIQTISGSGACYLALLFLKKFYLNNSISKIYLPNKTWANHTNIVNYCDLKYDTYRYYKNNKLDYNGLIEDLNKVNNGSIFIFHVCCHNPTGVDPTNKQWDTISKIAKDKNHIILFDCAYLGYGTGNYIEDRYSVNRFLKDNNRILVAQSFSKNMGLYSERLGVLSISCSNNKEKESTENHLTNLARAVNSSPPSYGSKIAEIVFTDKELYSIWLNDCSKMVNRLKDMRKQLKNKLEKIGSKYNWDFLVEQQGMFAYFELGQEKVDILKNKYHIYLSMDGRISISGLNSSNIDYVAKCLNEITKNSK